MSTVGVVVGTFGSVDWMLRGTETADRAKLSGADKVIAVHSGNLAEARNQGANIIGTDYIVFLDADDSLGKDYCTILKENIEPGNVIYQPQTIAWFGEDRFEGEPEFIPDRNMSDSNNLVIGSAVPAQYCVEFDPSLPALEDWDFFLRMIVLGAKVKQVPGMVYQVGINDNSRNAPSGSHNLAYSIIKSKGYNVSNYLLETK